MPGLRGSAVTAPEPFEWAPPAETEALFLASIEAHLKKVKAAARAPFSPRYANGDRKTFRTPDGEPLGMVYREDPDVTWVLSDTDAFAAAMEERGVDPWEPIGELLLPDGSWRAMSPDDELFRVVAEHAPHLTRTGAEALRDDVIRDLLAQSSADNKAAAPGISKYWPEGRLVVRAAEGAGAVFARLMRDGVIGWDGRPALPSGDVEGAA